MKSDLRKLLKALEDQGFTVRLSTKGHYLVDKPSGVRICVIAGTTGDVRSLANAIARLRRSGFVWPPPR